MSRLTAHSPCASSSIASSPRGPLGRHLPSVAAAVALSLAASSAALAADYNFNVANGAYNQGSNWSGGIPGLVPMAGDNATIDAGRVALKNDSAANEVNQLRVGDAGVGELRVSAGSLRLNGESFFGVTGNGTVSVSGNATLNAARVNIANGPNSNGTWTISGGTVAATDSTYVGLRGDGTLSQSAGTSSFSRLQIGQENESISRGTVRVTGGTMNVSGPIVGGENSRLANLVEITGGTVNTPESYAGANGIATIRISGTGTLNNVGQMHLGASGSGVGTLEVSGGNLNMTGNGGWILVGQNGSGTFNFSGGAIDTKILSVGQDATGSGTATQTGGTLRSQRTLVLGEDSVASNTYTLSGGSVDVGIAGSTGGDLDLLDGLGAFVGSGRGKGTLNLSGTGTFSSRTGLTIGYGVRGAADGTVNVGVGGTLSTVTSGIEGRVRIGVFAAATGRLNVAGGTASFAGPILNGVFRDGTTAGGTGIVNVTAGSLSAPSMTNFSTYTQSGGTASFGAVDGTGSVSVTGGAMTAQQVRQAGLSITGGTVTLAGGEGPTTSVVNTLALAGSGKLEIGRNGVVVDYTGASPIDAVRQAAAAGRLTATLSPADARQAVAYAEASAINATDLFGVAVDASAVVIRSRLRGDANFNGTVNFDDLLALARNYNGTGKVWTSGDFTYDGTTGFDDLLALARNYNAALTGGQSVTLGAAFAADFALAQSLVPEPTTLTALGLAGGLLARRRRA